MKEKYRKRAIMRNLLCLICLFLVGSFVYKHFIRVQNIFDQMYYNRVQTGFQEFLESASFDKMPQIDNGGKQWGRTVPYEGVFDNNYKKEYLNENERLFIVCERNQKVMSIEIVKQFDEFKICFQYIYDVRKKQLVEIISCGYGGLNSEETYRFLGDFKEYTEDLDKILIIIEEAGLTKEDLLQYKKYFLYDKLLTDWLAVSKSRFTVERWGRVKFIEVLPLKGTN